MYNQKKKSIWKGEEGKQFILITKGLIYPFVFLAAAKSVQTIY